MTGTADPQPLVAPLLHWYDEGARDLPWRRPGAGAWAVLVSEVMLQQTPVARVLPVYEQWLLRWPTASALAADAPGDAVRMWGRLGYPRRALRLHASAAAIRDRFDGEVPAEVADLLTLPGVGAYTARAVAAFAFGHRVPVVDTNVRRVVARAIEGRAEAGAPTVTRDLAAVAALLPADPPEAARFSVALMELGALVCTARAPRCAACPLHAQCRWVAAGRLPHVGPRARPQRFLGTDRQVRGLLLGAVREAEHPVASSVLDRTWPDAVQRDRALAGLITDGLLAALPDGRYTLPGVGHEVDTCAD